MVKSGLEKNTFEIPPSTKPLLGNTFQFMQGKILDQKYEFSQMEGFKKKSLIMLHVHMIYETLGQKFQTYSIWTW